MKTKKINLLVNLPPSYHTVAWLQPHWQRLRKLAVLRPASHNTPEEILRDLQWADAVLMWAWPGFDDAMLAQCPKLKFIGAINAANLTVHTALKLGITLSEVRHCWSPAVAEMALTLMLAGLRQTSAYHAAMRAGTEQWVQNFPADIDPRERQLTGRTVGLVGFGGIGRRLAELLQPFRVKLLVHDPYAPAKVLKQYGATAVPMSKLARTAEVLVLCAAVTPETNGILNRKLIMAMPSQSVLVNVSRSSLVDGAGLQERLAKGDLIALLDVFDQEPLAADSPWRSLPNTYLTPHRAGGLVESVDRALTWLTDDLEAHLQGRPVKYAVTKAMLHLFPL